MVTVRFFVKLFGGKPLLVLLAAIVLSTVLSTAVVSAQTKQDDKTKTVREVAELFIQAGKEQYQRGQYVQAEKSFLRAMDYQEYLTAAAREKLNELLEKAHIAVLERTRILERIQAADRLIKEGQLAAAKVHLEEIKDSKTLTDDERKKIAEGLARLDNQLSRQKEQIAETYNRSVELYMAGRFEDARRGFVEVARSSLLTPPPGKAPEDYIARIDEYLRQKGKTLPPAEAKPLGGPAERAPAAIEDSLLRIAGRPEAEPEALRPGAVTVTEPMVGEGTYIEQVKRKRIIRQRYTEIVVNDANDKAQAYMAQGKFDKAAEEVEAAARVVSEYQMDLGEDLFKQYRAQLTNLAAQIGQKRQDAARILEIDRQKAVQQAQQEYTQRTEEARKKRIDDLMNNAKAYQKQQRYEEALGQLEMLVALDPLNNDALLMKELLEDTISFRKQLQVQKEADMERANILLQTDESAIPYAEELTYPRDWREISAKRKPEEAFLQDPRDAAVYKQLEEVVDLSALSPQMPLGEAIELLRNAVDPRLKIVVLWGDLLENTDIDQTTPINMDPISAIPLRKALELMIESVAAGIVDLGYVVSDGVITVATVETLPSKLVTRVYDVTILLGRPAEYYDMGMMGMGGMGMGMGGMGMGMGGGGGYGGYGGGGYGGGGYGGGGYGGGGYGGGGYGGGGYGGGGYGRGGYGGGGYGRGGYGGGGYGGYGGGGYGGGGYGGGGYGGGGYGGGGYGGYGGGGYGGGGYGMGMGMGSGMETAEREYRADNLIMLMQDTIEPDSWWETGTGEGTITAYQGRKLIVLQTPEIHTKIETLLSEMRKALGHQVAIEARFLVVTENFLEDIGLDVNFRWRPGDKWHQFVVDQGSYEAVAPTGTKVPGSLGGTVSGLSVGGGWGSSLDDLDVTFLLRAVEAHTDAKTLTAPKVTVLSGESATLQVMTDTVIALPPQVGTEVIPGGISGAAGLQSFTPSFEILQTGTTLSITPIISPDRKHVLLNITTTLLDFLGLKTYNLETPLPDGTVAKYKQDLPETETSQVMTRVSVPDGGTLLLGGQKVTAEVEKEAGVPVVGKIPVLGRLFTNRSKVRDHKILLILVKPTIILQEERDAEAIAAMENSY